MRRQNLLPLNCFARCLRNEVTVVIHHAMTLCNGMALPTAN